MEVAYEERPEICQALTQYAEKEHRFSTVSIGKTAVGDGKQDARDVSQQPLLGAQENQRRLDFVRFAELLVNVGERRWADDTGVVQAVVVSADGHLEQSHFGRVEKRAADIGEDDQDEDKYEGERV